MKTGRLDRALDWAVLPGYSSIGYRIRSRGFDPVAPQALAGRAVLITGASAGLGEATCELAARWGAEVHMLVRNPEKGEAARARVAERTGAEPRIWTANVSSLESIRGFVASFVTEVPALAGLVNNAGVLPPRRERTGEGFELTFATNALGPFLLTALLQPALQAAESARVVNVSSGGMYTARLDANDLQLDGRDFDGTAFYAHTKRIEVILTELWQEHAGNGVSFHSMHPGWADTPGVKASLPTFQRFLRPVLRNAEQGADTIAWLLAAPEPARHPGCFWHDRRRRPTHRLARTRETAAERERLWAELTRLSGWEG
jgi:NAD(P)-dependent dehydrogenase (short-subunit alcohol dehydrogenase family)